MFLVRRITFFLSFLTSIVSSQNVTAQESTPPAVLMDSENKIENATFIPEQALNITAASAATNSTSPETSMSTDLSTEEGTTARINETTAASSSNTSEMSAINQTGSSLATDEPSSEQQVVKEVTTATNIENATSDLSPEAVMEQSTISLSTSEGLSNNSASLPSGEIQTNSSSDLPLESSSTIPSSQPATSQFCPCPVSTESPTSPRSEVRRRRDIEGGIAPVSEVTSVTPSTTNCVCPNLNESTDVSSSATTISSLTTTISSSSSTTLGTVATSSDMMNSSNIAELIQTKLPADPVQFKAPGNVVEVVSQKQAGFLPAPISVTLKVK